MLAVLASAPPARAEDSQAEALVRIERLVTAARVKNYDATFVYSHDHKMDEMRIIHRYADGVERERLVTLSGSAREVLRDDTLVTCIIPDRQSVTVGKSRPRGLYRSPGAAAQDYTRHYVLSLEGRGRVAARQAEIVLIRPRDKFRYGYRLWVDTDSGLLLRSELFDEEGAVLEGIVYTSLRTPSSIPDELLEPEVSDTGFSWHASTGGMERPEKAAEWVARWIPPGFEMRDHESTLLPAGRMPLEHLVYGDGLASLSVYVEELDASAKALEGMSRIGAMNAFGTMVGGFQVTVVGEVPQVTVETVARSVERVP